MSYTFGTAMGEGNQSIDSRKLGGDHYSYPQVIWTYLAVSDPQSSRLMDLVLKQWSRAYRHGLKIRDVSYFGRSLTDREVDHCNLFLQSGGTVEASKLRHWDAVKFFDREVLRLSGK